MQLLIIMLFVRQAEVSSLKCSQMPNWVIYIIRRHLIRYVPMGTATLEINILVQS